MDNAIVSIKCSFDIEGEVESRRFTCTGYEDFLQLVEKYTGVERLNLKFRYLDSDDDWVTFSSPEEWNCIQGAEGRFLKVKVTSVRRMKIQAPSCSAEKVLPNSCCERFEELKAKGIEAFEKLTNPKYRLKVRLGLIWLFLFLIFGWKFILGGIFGKVLFKKIKKKLSDIDGKKEVPEEEEEKLEKMD